MEKDKIILNFDERDALIALYHSDGWMPLTKIMNHVVRRMQENVIKFDLSRGAEQLLLEKARAEGALATVKTLFALKEKEIKQDKEFDAALDKDDE